MAESLRLEAVHRTYEMGRASVHALRDVSLAVEEGTAVAVVGPSGSGKSTLLHICGALDLPTSGTVSVLGEDLSRASDATRTRFRREHLGFIFQAFHLLPTLTARENVLIPARLARMGRAEAERRAVELLERVGLADRVRHRPSELSGGERQRVAIARALILDPRIILADEPTGNLDHEMGGAVLDLLMDLAHGQGRTVVIVTHDLEVAQSCDRQIRLRDGRIQAEA